MVVVSTTETYLADAKCLKFCDDTKASLAAVAAAAAQGLERTELLDVPVTAIVYINLFLPTLAPCSK